MSGLRGRLHQAVTVDLLDLPPQDIFAFYAGVNALHEEIQERPIEELSEGYEAEIARLERRLRDESLDDIQPRRFGLFFGDRVLVAEANRLGEPGIAVTDRVDMYWFPNGNKDRPLGPAEAFALYKGRKLLRAFNPLDDASSSEDAPQPPSD